MRDTGNSWAEIAKVGNNNLSRIGHDGARLTRAQTFPARTEGSVKKHWYKDMHYAEFAEDEVRAA